MGDEKKVYVINDLMPKEVNEVIIDLKYTIGLPSGSRLSIHDKQYSSYSFFESAKRTLWGESRLTTYNWISDLINRANDVIRSNPEWQELIRIHVKDLERPIKVLMQTYRNDPDIVSKFSTLLISLDLPRVVDKNKHSEQIIISKRIENEVAKNIAVSANSYKTAPEYEPVGKFQD